MCAPVGGQAERPEKISIIAGRVAKKKNKNEKVLTFAMTPL